MKRYSNVSTVKSEGVTFTPPSLAKFMAENIAKKLSENHNVNKIIKIFDPACGDGALLLAAGLALKKHGFTKIELTGFDVNGENLRNAATVIEEQFIATNFDLIEGDFLEHSLSQRTNGDLFKQSSPMQFDAAIANPPYVRTQVLGAERAQELSKNFGLKGRLDLYHPFFIAINEMLTQSGVIGIVTSNRYMNIKSGKTIREYIANHYDLSHIFDFGDTKLFDAAVLPAVLFGTKKKAGYSNSSPSLFTTIYESQQTTKLYTEVNNIIEAVSEEGIVHVAELNKNYEVKQGELKVLNDSDGIWRLSSSTGDTWLNEVDKNTWHTFQEIGKIRVGVKTTADKVFIKKASEDWEGDRPELLRNLTTHHIARKFAPTIPEGTKEILYTHEVKGGKRAAVMLDQHPISLKYLESHKEQLESRKYVIDSGRNWYEIWVPQDPGQWEKPKLVMRDISEKPCFWMDLSGTIVNGDCYWLAAEENNEELLWLALGVSNSKFIEEFYDHKFNNKLYSGRRRFITQYVKKFPIPDPTTEYAEKIISIAKDLYQSTVEYLDTSEKECELDRLVYGAFGLNTD
jgi:adenine-specific DNA-methyltransferase